MSDESVSDESVSDEELRAMRTRHEAATPGPWVSCIEGRNHESGSGFIRTAGADIELTGATKADQDFIAHAYEDLDRLLTEVSRLRVLAGISGIQ